MKKLFITLTLGALLASPVFAAKSEECPGGICELPENKKEVLFKEVKSTDESQAALKEINELYLKTRQAGRDAQGSKEEKMKEAGLDKYLETCEAKLDKFKGHKEIPVITHRYIRGLVVAEKFDKVKEVALDCLNSYPAETPGQATVAFYLAWHYEFKGRDKETAKKWLQFTIDNFDDEPADEGHVKGSAEAQIASANGKKNAHPLDGKAAPKLEVNLLDGNKFNLADQKGNVSVVVFSGTWCGWCVKEIPELKKIWDDYKDGGKVNLLTLWCESKKTENEIKDFVKEQGIGYSGAFIEKDTQGELKKAFSVQGFPTIFVIDGEGNVVGKARGYADIKETIEKAFGNDTGADKKEDIKTGNEAPKREVPKRDPNNRRDIQKREAR